MASDQNNDSILNLEAKRMKTTKNENVKITKCKAGKGGGVGGGVGTGIFEMAPFQIHFKIPGPKF